MLDWKVFFAVFGTIFLAELGDKTQLANLTLSARSGSKVVVLLASVIAFSVVTLITVSLGGIISKFVRPEHIRYGAATLFIIVGLLILIGKL